MKRFWKDVSVALVSGGWQIALDGKPLKTQRGAQQILPTRALAEALATEWRDQGETIDTAAFPLRDMADYAIDQVRTHRDETVTAILPYAETDTLCYRADDGDALRERQEEAWEPMVCDAERRFSIALPRVAGVGFAALESDTTKRLMAEVAAKDDFALAALQNLASLAASLVVGLAALDPDADEDALFAAANLEEDWQAQLWGWDSDALTRRTLRAAAFSLARRFALLANDADG